MKACIKCNLTLPLSEFYKRSGYPNRTHGSCKTCHTKYEKNRYVEKKSSILEYKKRFHEANPDKVKKKMEAFRKRRPMYQTERYRTEPLFRMKACVRVRIRQVLVRNGYRKGSNSEKIIGCSFDELRSHLENKFYAGMSWANYGKWHIDHIVPLCTAKSEDELITLCHFKNLQPLWAADNLAKSRKLPEAA